LYDYFGWDNLQDSDDWGKPFVKVAGVIYEMPEGESNYRKSEG
jgi:hypothetical protein